MARWAGRILRGHVGPNRTDRGKDGAKRRVIVEADGGPVGVVVAGANVQIGLNAGD